MAKPSVKLSVAAKIVIAAATAPVHWYRANCQGNSLGYAASVTPGKWYSMQAPTKGTTLAALVARARARAIGNAPTKAVG